MSAKRSSSGCGCVVVILIGVAIYIGHKMEEEERRRQQQWQQQQQQPWQQSQPSQQQPPTPLPDLVIIGGSYQPPYPVVPQGTYVEFHLIVKNIGMAPASGFINVTGPGNVSGGFPGGLAPNQTKTAVVRMPLYGQNAVHTFHFEVDAGNGIREANESNNASQTFQIRSV